MRAQSKYCFAIVFIVLMSISAFGQCPDRPSSGTVVFDAPSLTSTNGVLNAQFTMAQSVDGFGYTHYCYKYLSGTQTVVGHHQSEHGHEYGRHENGYGPVYRTRLRRRRPCDCQLNQRPLSRIECSAHLPSG